MPSRFFHLAKAYLKHQITAHNEHGLHSPFLFELYTQALIAPKHYYAFDTIQALREKLRKEQKKIAVQDFGAGSKKLRTKERSVGDITKYSSISPKKGELLFRMVSHLAPQNLVELGTSVGLGTLYLQLPNTKANVFTFEGDASIAAIAQQNFKKFNVSPTLIEGNIDDTLPKALSEIAQIDLLYIDANHQYEATLAYFNQCKPYLHEQAVVMFDDIRWSEGMERAWATICADASVTLSLDFFDFGLVFFRKKQPKQHFKLRY